MPKLDFKTKKVVVEVWNESTQEYLKEEVDVVVAVELVYEELSDGKMD